MILTEDFVFLHMPKTGGTFVAAMLAELYPSGLRRWKRRLRRGRPLRPPLRAPAGKHAPRTAIALSHQNLPILATIRSPWESYVSDYEFGEWRRGADNQAMLAYDWRRIVAENPQFPNLSFAEYLAVFGQVGYRLDVPDRPELGWRTVRFAWQFSPMPAPTVASSNDELRDGVTRSGDVTFIHTENLRVELHDRLVELGLHEREVAFIRSAAKVLPSKGGRRDDQRWEQYYDDELYELVARMDAPLLDRFPEYVSAPPPM